MSKGWIKLHRQIQDCFLWDDGEPFSRGQAWVDLLLLCSHSDKKILFNGEETVVGRGSFVTTIRSLANKWNWSTNRLYRYINLLEKEHMIERRTDTHRTIIKVLNYNIYQDSDSESETPTDTQTDTQTDTVTDTATKTQVNTSTDTQTDTQIERARQQSGDTTDTLNKNERIKEYNIYKELSNDNSSSVKSDGDAVRKSEIKKLALEHWNALPSVPPYKSIRSGGKTEQLLMTRVKDHGLEDVLKTIDSIAMCPWLLGRGGKWIATFDWLVHPENFEKVFNGKYLDRNAVASNQPEGNEYADYE